jgi:hypothetical protein
MLNNKINELVRTKVSQLHEGDFWHPDPAQDRKLGGPGANQRAREDRAAASKKEDPRKLRPGESYMDFAKRHGYKSRTESHVPGQPAERLGAVTAIPQKERDAARERTLAKAKAMREKNKKKIEEKIDVGADAGATISDFVHSTDSRFSGDSKKQRIKRALGAYYAARKEEFEIEEGMDMKAFKQQRSRQKQKEKRAAEKTSPLRRAGIHDDNASPERAARHRANVDPDFEGNDERNYPGGKLKNPKKIRKAKAVGELTKESLSFSDFMEARRMDKEGVDRGDTLRANRTARAKASVEAVKKRQAVLDKHEKKTGTKLDISRSKEGQAHARNHPGSRQAPKVKGAKETPLETHNRRVNRQVSRVVKHGHTTKEKEANRGIYSSRFD